MAVSSVFSIGTASPASRARLLWGLWVLAAIIGGIGFISRLGNPRQNPIRDLPITANPTMLPAGVAQVTLRELIIELNITG